jgi:hypothetical protein
VEDELGFELLAASLRASSGDLETFVEVLADKLEHALPGRVKIERRSAGLFSKQRRVERIEVELGDERYVLGAHGAELDARRAKAVRGVVLKTERLSLEAWIDELARDLTCEAEGSEQSRLALERLLKD